MVRDLSAISIQQSAKPALVLMNIVRSTAEDISPLMAPLIPEEHRIASPLKAECRVPGRDCRVLIADSRVLF